jgi:NADH-quinone oxidoreductase subunit C
MLVYHSTVTTPRNGGPRDGPACALVPSIAAVFSGADWHERECFDFFGVVPKPSRPQALLLPDDLDSIP